MNITEYSNQFAELKLFTVRDNGFRCRFLIKDCNGKPLPAGFSIQVANTPKVRLISFDGELTKKGQKYLDDKIASIIYRTLIRKLKEQDDE